ncbi:MAG: rhodanese-like domain-containing protein [Desulfocapsaceae bacterium]
MKHFLPVALVTLLVLSLINFLLPGPTPQVTSADQQPGRNVQENVQDEERVKPAIEVQPVFRTVSAAEAAELVKTRENLQIIDVRTPQERKQFRIADSKLVPVGDVIRGVFEADPDQPLMLICAVGGRSYVAGKVMFARGYREIYNLDGGIESWRRAGFPIETSPEETAR